MKHSLQAKSWLPVQLLAILLALPLLMGQYDCQGVADRLIKAIEQLTKEKIGSTAPPDQKYIYITRLSFIDPITGMGIIATEEAHLLNDAVKAGIDQALNSNPLYQYNARNHRIEDTDANNEKLIGLMLDPNKIQARKVKDIINQMLIPNHVDVAVTGNYVDHGDTIHIMPMIVVRTSEKMTKKKLSFSKPDYICPDPASSKKALCKQAYEKIALAVKDLLESL